MPIGQSTGCSLGKLRVRIPEIKYLGFCLTVIARVEVGLRASLNDVGFEMSAKLKGALVTWRKSSLGNATSERGVRSKRYSVGRHRVPDATPPPQSSRSGLISLKRHRGEVEAPQRIE